jgi:hypothetical protein
MFILGCLAKVFSLLAFSLFCCIKTCHLNIFLFGFHEMDKTVQIDEEKKQKNSGACMCIHPLCYETPK